jgi:hypothetical protein
MLASLEKLVLHSDHSLEHELGEESHRLASAGLSWMWIAASACAGALSELVSTAQPARVDFASRHSGCSTVAPNCGRCRTFLQHEPAA